MRRRADVARLTSQGKTPSYRHRLLPAVLALLLVAVAVVAWLLEDLAGLGSAFTANYLCSQVFVAGRAAEAVAREDLPAFRSAILDRVRWRLDLAGQRVQADLLGLALNPGSWDHEAFLHNVLAALGTARAQPP